MNQPKIILLTVGKASQDAVNNESALCNQGQKNSWPIEIGMENFYHIVDKGDIQLLGRAIHVPGNEYILIQDQSKTSDPVRNEVVDTLLGMGAGISYLEISDDVFKNLGKMVSTSMCRLAANTKIQDKEKQHLVRKIKTTHLIFIGEKLEFEINGSGPIPLSALVDDLISRGGKKFSFTSTPGSLFDQQLRTFSEGLSDDHSATQYLIFYDQDIYDNLAARIGSQISSSCISTSSINIKVIALPVRFRSVPTTQEIMYNAIYNSMLPTTPLLAPRQIHTEAINIRNQALIASNALDAIFMSLSQLGAPGIGNFLGASTPQHPGSIINHHHPLGIFNQPVKKSRSKTSQYQITLHIYFDTASVQQEFHEWSKNGGDVLMSKKFTSATLISCAGPDVVTLLNPVQPLDRVICLMEKSARTQGARPKIADALANAGALNTMTVKFFDLEEFEAFLQTPSGLF